MKNTLHKVHVTPTNRPFIQNGASDYKIVIPQNANESIFKAASFLAEYLYMIEGRMTGRRVCTKCGASYHIVANPPKSEGICDQCGGEVAIRKDDTPETVRHRLEVYHQSTEVLKDYYAKQGKLCLVNADQSIEDANRDILKGIGEKV